MNNRPSRLEQLIQEKITSVQNTEPAPQRPAPQLGADQLGRMIDHTILKADATRAQVIALCQQAAEYHFAAVCVNPVYVSLCHHLLEKTDVHVCSVIGFPLGATLTQVKVYAANQVIAEGATEVDMVIAVGALKDRNYDQVYDDIAAVAQTCHTRHALLKVIIENALLADEDKIAACYLAQKAGADLVKTSTGFAASGAKAQDVALMRKTIGADMGIKAAGGIRTYQDAMDMIRAGATRLGASAGVQIVTQARAEEAT